MCELNNNLVSRRTPKYFTFSSHGTLWLLNCKGFCGVKQGFLFLVKYIAFVLSAFIKILHLVKYWNNLDNADSKLLIIFTDNISELRMEVSSANMEMMHPEIEGISAV